MKGFSFSLLSLLCLAEEVPHQSAVPIIMYSRHCLLSLRCMQTPPAYKPNNHVHLLSKALYISTLPIKYLKSIDTAFLVNYDTTEAHLYTSVIFKRSFVSDPCDVISYYGIY